MSLHIGIIMDGNGRWATAQNKPRTFGHAEGVEAVKKIIKACPDMGVTAVTLFAFAIANWKRDKEEVDGLWDLFHALFVTDMKMLVEEGVRVRVIGNRQGLPEKVREEIEIIEESSKTNTKFLFQMALNYDGIEEVARLIKRAINDKVPTEDITSDYVLSHLDTEADNNPDIIIRTGMDKPQEKMAIWRSSAFLSLQSAQSVCVSTTTLWPAFTATDLEKIIIYAKPDARLFGGQRA